MLSSARLAIISCAIEQGSLSGGGLVRWPPPEQGWAITTEVPARTLEKFRAERNSAVVTSDVLGVAATWVCWVFGYQVGSIQHRVFLPLVGRSVRDLIQSAKRSDLRLLMDAGEADAALQARIPASATLLASLQKHWRVEVEPSEASEHLLVTAGRLLVPSALDPALGVRRASTVSVTAVIPDDVPFNVEGTTANALWQSALSRNGPQK